MICDISFSDKKQLVKTLDVQRSKLGIEMKSCLWKELANNYGKQLRYLSKKFRASSFHMIFFLYSVQKTLLVLNVKVKPISPLVLGRFI